MPDEPVIEPAPEVDRTLIREWIIDRIKTDEYLMKQYHTDAEFYARVNLLMKTDNNQEATDFLISVLLGTDLKGMKP